MARELYHYRFLQPSVCNRPSKMGHPYNEMKKGPINVMYVLLQLVIRVSISLSFDQEPSDGKNNEYNTIRTGTI